MTSFMLTRSSEIDRARVLLELAAKEWGKTVREPIPPDMLELLARLK